MSSAPIVDRIRIIPRPGDFLDRNVGASGEVFFNRATNSLRVYSGKDRAGFEIARADLSNVDTSLFGINPDVASVKFDVIVTNTGEGNKYVLNGDYWPELNFVVGYTYVFNQNDPTNVYYPNQTGGTNNQHPLNFSADDINGELDGGTVYTDNVTYKLDNTVVTKQQYWDGFEAASQRSVEILVTSDTPSTLYYWCQNHLYMGRSISVAIPGSGTSQIDNGTSVDVSADTPTDPVNGNLWLDTNTGKLYIYIDDGDSEQWIQPVIQPLAANNTFATVLSDNGTFSADSDQIIPILGGTHISTEVVPASGELTINLNSFPLEFLSDISSAAPSSGQVLKWNGTQWAPGTVVAEVSFASNIQVDDIEINDNYITTTTSNANLELGASGTGTVYVPDNNVQIDNNLTVNGTTTLATTVINGSVSITNNVTQIGDVTLTGNVTQIGDVTQTGTVDITGNENITGTLTTGGQAQFENIQINNNYITTTDTNSDLELRANGTGSVIVSTNDVAFNQNVTINGIATINNLDSSGTITANSLSTGDILIDDNFITTTLSNSDLELRANGTGNVIVPTADINGGTIDDTVIGESIAAAGTFTALAANYLNEGVYELTGTDIDPANGAIQYKTLAATTTFTESLSSGDSIVLRISGGDTFIVNWPAITWVTVEGDVAPTLGGSDVVVLWQEDAIVYGAYVGSYA